MFFGVAGAPTQLGATTAYRHTLTLANSLDGLFGTLAVYDGIIVRETPSVKVRGLEFTGRAGEAIQLRVMVIPDDRLEAGQVNTTLASVTFIAVDPRLMFDDALIRINTASGGALANSDTFYASAFTLSMERPFRSDHVTDRRRSVSEPIADGKPTFQLSMTEDRFSTVSRITDLKNRVLKKVDIEFLAGVNAGTAYPYRMYFELPAMAYSDVRIPVSGPGAIVPDIVLQGEEAVTAPTGMVGLVKPVRLSLDNIQTVDSLA